MDSKWTFLGKDGWPVETIKGRPILNFIRRLIHTRKIVRGWHSRKEFYKADEALKEGDDVTE